MRVTRSASATGVTQTVKRSAPASVESSNVPLYNNNQNKRIKSSSSTSRTQPVDAVQLALTQHDIKPVTTNDDDPTTDEQGILMHPKLSFSFQEARRHLISIDSRWQPLMDKLRCTPFQEESETPFNPFRSLVSSIIGQQVSWLAARSIQHKFQRLFFPHLPEKRAPPTTSAPEGSTDAKAAEETPFPTPAQVLALPDCTATLRSAGLSGRKTEYIIELAERFHDGRLSAKKLWESSDDEIMRDLVAVRGIGPWTVHMFLIFSSRRPDVCPPGDLGIQRALCSWYTDDPHNSRLDIHSRKLKPAPNIEPRESTPPPPMMTIPASLPPSTPISKPVLPSDSYPTPSSPMSSSREQVEEIKMVTAAQPRNPFVWPETTNDLTVATLKSRLNGKKLKGNLYLSPQECVDLMEPFRPYRSVACYYLWALQDGTGDP